jgi:hypothetical protein
MYRILAIKKRSALLRQTIPKFAEADPCDSSASHPRAIYRPSIGPPWVSPDRGIATETVMGRNQHRAAGRYELAFGQGTVSVVLEAPDRASAFETAQRLVKDGRPATLYEDGAKLATLSYSPEGFWTVSDVGAAA